MTNNKLDKNNLSVKNLIGTSLILIFVPLTIYLGIVYLGDRKYYFISLLIVIYSLIAFLMRFEKREPKMRELILIAVLVAIGVAGRGAFYMIPQFKPVLAVAIIAGVSLDAKSGFLVGALIAFVSNFFFGQGPWTPWQMFAMGMIGLLAGVFFDKGRLKHNKIYMAVFGFISAIVIYGGIMNPASLLIFQPRFNIDAIINSYILGFPFDLILAVATFVFLYLIGEPMLEKIERVKIKYGLL